MSMPKITYRQGFRGRSYKNQELTGADFSKADVRGSDFSGATLINVNFTDALLCGANFSGARFGDQQELTGADFSNANIRGVNFSEATLIGSTFIGAKAGLQLQSVIIYALCCLVMAAISGFIATFSVMFIGSYLIPGATTNSEGNFGMGGTILSTIALIVLSYVLFRMIRPGTKLESIIVSLSAVTITVAGVAIAGESLTSIAALAVVMPLQLAVLWQE